MICILEIVNEVKTRPPCKKIHNHHCLQNIQGIKIPVQTFFLSFTDDTSSSKNCMWGLSRKQFTHNICYYLVTSNTKEHTLKLGTQKRPRNWDELKIWCKQHLINKSRLNYRKNAQNSYFIYCFKHLEIFWCLWLVSLTHTYVETHTVICV